MEAPENAPSEQHMTLEIRVLSEIARRYKVHPEELSVPIPDHKAEDLLRKLLEEGFYLDNGKLFSALREDTQLNAALTEKLKSYFPWPIE